jgi:hypothetical protein
MNRGCTPLPPSATMAYGGTALLYSALFEIIPVGEQDTPNLVKPMPKKKVPFYVLLKKSSRKGVPARTVIKMTLGLGIVIFTMIFNDAY